MSRRSRRHVRVPPDLTSLFDVLFIVIFVALIRAAAAQQSAAEAARPVQAPPPAPLPPAEPLPTDALHDRALVQIMGDVGNRPVVVARITGDGTLDVLELGDKRLDVDVPLLEESRDPDVALAYLGDRSAELRVCRQAALYLGLASLAGHLVIIAPNVRSADLPHALYEGLRRDVERCQTDQRGLAVVVEPEGAEP